MPKIAEIVFYDGAEEKVRRLGLNGLFEEIKEAVTAFRLIVKPECNANSGGVLRQMIDAQFRAIGGWTRRTAGDIDWRKCKIVNGTQVCIGVEVQVSARSDLVFRDVVHFRNQMAKGLIDVGVEILPSDALSYFLTDRAPAMSDGKRIMDEMRADDLPLVFFAIEHDATGHIALPKMITRQGKPQ